MACHLLDIGRYEKFPNRFRQLHIGMFRKNKLDNHAVNDYFRHIVYDGIILLFHGHGLLPE